MNHTDLTKSTNDWKRTVGGAMWPVRAWKGLRTLVLLAAVCAWPHGAIAQQQEVEREGAVSALTGSCPTLEFSVGPTAVSISAATEFEDGVCADLRNGTRVEVEGIIQGDGRLAAAEVEFEDDDDSDDEDDDD